MSNNENIQTYKKFSSIVAFYDYVESRFIKTFNSYDHENFVKIKGKINLGDRQKKYFFGKIYNNKEAVTLWIPLEIGDPLKERMGSDFQGTVLGEAKIRKEFGCLRPYIIVHDIEVFLEPTKEQVQAKQREENLIHIWREYGIRYDHDFPDHPYISVIRPSSSTAFQDFFSKIKDYNFEIEDIPTDITCSESLVEAILQAKGNILVILRGGGVEEAFSVFNDLEVVKCWAAKDSFKILALGHTEHKGYLLEMFSDVVKRTPTEAAEYLIFEVEKRKLLVDCESLKGKLSVLEKNREKTIKERDDLRKQLSELEKEKIKLEANINRLKSLEKESEELRKQVNMLTVLKGQILEKEKLLEEKDKILLKSQKEMETLRIKINELNKKIEEMSRDIKQKTELLKNEQNEKIAISKQLKRSKKSCYLFLLLGILIGLLATFFINLLQGK